MARKLQEVDGMTVILLIVVGLAIVLPIITSLINNWFF